MRTLTITTLTALLVLAGGLVYAFAGPTDHRSSGRLVLAPRADTLEEEADLTYGYLTTSVLSTWVEHIDSQRILDRAGRPDVDITVRAVPESRVIDVTAVGARDHVQPAVAAIVQAARVRDGGLDDAWSARVLQPAGTAEPAGPGLPQRVAAAVALALLAALIVVGLLGWPARPARGLLYPARHASNAT